MEPGVRVILQKPVRWVRDGRNFISTRLLNGCCRGSLMEPVEEDGLHQLLWHHQAVQEEVVGAHSFFEEFSARIKIRLRHQKMGRRQIWWGSFLNGAGGGGKSLDLLIHQMKERVVNQRRFCRNIFRKKFQVIHLIARRYIFSETWGRRQIWC